VDLLLISVVGSSRAYCDPGLENSSSQGLPQQYVLRSHLQTLMEREDMDEASCLQKLSNHRDFNNFNLHSQEESSYESIKCQFLQKKNEIRQLRGQACMHHLESLKGKKNMAMA